MNFYFKETIILLNMTQENENEFENSDNCWFCDLDFNEGEKKLEIIVI